MPGVRPLTADEVRRTVRAMREIADPLLRARDTAMVVTQATTGFRIREVLRLTLGHVAERSAAGPRIRSHVIVERRLLKGGKTGKTVRSRQVKLDKAAWALRPLINLLSARGMVQPGTRLFIGHNAGGAITTRQALRRYHAAFERAGVEDRVATHSLRKFFGLSAYETHGKDIAAAAVALGQENVSVTMRYLGKDQSVVDRVVDELPDLSPES